ncbi:ABC transporter permease [Zhihengliuella salsuginis]|uniref:ABC transporter n=1 Tax=Zhihengliuella salsuginis TaxID=578222 RepID=A0ABQ3GCI8_9MICC|nr:polyketide antibiotic transporter [Zhihengliuella salsuginis]GHC99678.1 ABC transporter [Zhihengliuella salsuginis]
MSTAFAGTGRLAVSMLRADRVRVPVWVLVMVAFVAYAAGGIPAVMGEEGLQARAEVMKEPAGAMMAGPGYGIEDYSIEILMANEMLGMFAVMVAIMSLLLVVRHTRAEEEAGRTELVRAAPVGRYAQLTAALIVLVAANAAVALGMGAALVGTGMEPVLDAWVFGAGLGAVGLVFGAAAALTVQLSSNARAASGMAGALVGAAYVLRAVGDAQAPGGSVLSWLSPIGWVQQMRIFAGLRLEPAWLAAGAVVVLVSAAYALAARRDVGAGLLPERRGRANATPAGRTLLGLTARLERPRLVWWAVGLFVFGALTGSLAGPMSEVMREQPQLLAVLGVDPGDDDAMANLVSEAMGMFLMFFAMAVAVYAAAAARGLLGDETACRSELALSAVMPRAWWLGAPLLVSLLGSTALLVVSGVGLGAGASAAIGPAAVGDFALAALAYAPLLACWAAAAMLLYGAGRGSAVLWVALIAAFVIGMYGRLLDVPQAVQDAEPFSMVDAMALVGGDGDWTPLWVAGIVAAVLSAAAMIAFRRRDLAA